jgi:UDP-glucose 4-epimerase
MKVLVTGAAGFIGSNLADRLLSGGHEVIGYDNFSTGQEHFLRPAYQSAGFRLHRNDLLDLPALQQAMAGVELVVHLAANADVRFGTDHPTKDLEQNTIATSNVLEAMRRAGVKRIAFASLYGASKLAAEGLISAYCEGFGFQAYIFRFVSILGERYSHGHIFDFYRQLLEHPGELLILGNGTQRKSYLYVQDCIDAMLLALEGATAAVNIRW